MSDEDVDQPDLATEAQPTNDFVLPGDCLASKIESINGIKIRVLVENRYSLRTSGAPGGDVSGTWEEIQTKLLNRFKATKQGFAIPVVLFHDQDYHTPGKWVRAILRGKHIKTGAALYSVHDKKYSRQNIEILCRSEEATDTQLDELNQLKRELDTACDKYTKRRNSWRRIYNIDILLKAE